MIIVKFFVLLGCYCVFSAAQMNYCKISSNHTLCQFKIPGPSLKCKFYYSTALLSDQEIKEFLQKINERRNFIANGNSHLPQAANMNKMHWSSELAKFAQHWADQCDPSVHPDKEDECRDLENTKVGQNIASVTGRSSSHNVKDFIEMWFSQILDYSGTVTYYNQSRDNYTNYFTQLIWAETKFVGCGKVKFYENTKKILIERLVCNFAPKGNIDGKPIYIIGNAGARCANNMISDKDYKGLCDYAVKELRTQRPVVSALLRIRNLSNKTVKHESETISNFKQRHFRKNLKKNKIIRHVLSKYSYEPLKLAPLRKKSLTHMPDDINNKDGRHERGHSRIYHGHEEPAYPIPHYYEANINQEVTVAPIYLISSPNHIKDYQYIETSPAIPSQYYCYDHQCTRDQFHGYHQSIGWQNDKNPTPTPHLCPSTTACTVTCPIACPPLLTTVRNNHMNCQCSRHTFQSHIPNMVRNGNNHMTTRISPPMKDGYQQYYDSKFSERHKIHGNIEHDDVHEHISDENDYPEYNMRDQNYFYRSFDSNIRKRRRLEGKNPLKPF